MRFASCRLLLSVAATAAAAREPRRRPAGPPLAGGSGAALGAPRRPSLRPRPWAHLDPGAVPDETGAVLALSEDHGATRRGVNIAATTTFPASDVLEHGDPEGLRNLTTTLKFTAGDILEHEDPVGVVAQRARTMRKEINEFPKHLNEMWRSNFDVLRTLMPGMKLRRSTTHYLPMILAFSMLWMTFFFTKLYKDDHEESQFPEWEERAVCPQAAPGSVDCADIVLVFRRPDPEHPDTSKQVPAGALKEMLLYDKARNEEDEERVRERFRDFKEFLEDGTRHQDNDPETPGQSGPMSLGGRAMHAGRRATRAVSRATDEMMTVATGRTVEKIIVTDACAELMQDMFKNFPTLMGFDVSIFRSVDNAELFLTISLCRKQWISYYLSENGPLLQITSSVVAGLGVAQDSDDPNSSPPFVAYNQDLARDMYQKRVISSVDDRSLYRTWYDRNQQGSVLSSRERINIILGELNKCFDLDAAEDIGMLIQWYPAHSEPLLMTLRQKWVGSWLSFTFVQPIDLIREYFGSQMAFNFAWQGHYCKGLVALSVVAVGVELLLKEFPPILADVNLINSRVMLPFSIVLVIWARLMANMWEREEEYFKHQWEMRTGNVHRLERPSFRGKLCESDADKNLMDDRMPRGAAARRKLCSMCITLSCCCFVMSVISTWIYMHDGALDLVSSLTLSLFIKIFELCYNAVSFKLTQHENHKYEDSFHDSGVWHQFLFQAINSYWAVVSIAINQLWSGRCEEHSCLESLKIQTTMLMLILLSCSIAFATIELVLVRVSIELENLNLKRRLGKEEAERRKNQRSFLEEQAKYTKYDTKEQIENTLQLVLALGYVLVFGTLQPLVVPLCLLHFAVTIRVRAALLTRYAKRCVPYKLLGIGAWKHAVYILMNAGVFFSALLLVYWGRFFKGGALVAKLTGMIMWLVTASCLWFVVDVLVPPHSSDLRVLKTRRAYVERILTEISLHKHLDSKVEDHDVEEIRNSARASQSEGVRRPDEDHDVEGHDADQMRTSSKRTSSKASENLPLRRQHTKTSFANQIVRQRARRLIHTRSLGRTTGDEDIAPDDARCAQLVASRQWSSIPMLDSGGGRPAPTPRTPGVAQGEPGSK